MNKKDIIRKEIVMYTIYGLCWLAVHMVCHRYGDDMIWVQRAQSIHSIADLWDNYIAHISTWSSRFLIDFIGRIIELLPMLVWKVLDTLMILFMVYQLNQLFNKEKNPKVTAFIMAICCIYPFVNMSSAGWMASTFTYLWPLICAIYAIKICVWLIRGKEVKWWQYMLGIATFLYAIDQQQMAAMMSFLGIGLVLILFVEKKKSYYIYGVTMVSIARVILHMTWGGSVERMDKSIAVWFPDFGMMSLVDKLQIGFATAARKIFMDETLVFVVMGMILAILIFAKFDDVFHRCIVLIPNVVLLAWGPLRPLLEKYFPYIYSIDTGYSNLYGMVNNENYPNFIPYVVLFIWGFSLICMISSIIAVYGMKEKGILYSGLLLGGVLSRMIMGFSPTVYGSGARTYVFLYFSFIILSIAFAKTLVENKEKDTRWVFGAVYMLGVVNMIQILNMARIVA